MENPIRQTLHDLNYYLELWTDKFKLRLVDNFSSLLSSILSVFIVIILLSFALVMLSIAAAWGIAMLVGSQLWAVLILAGIYLLIALIIYSWRKQMFVNPIMRMLSKLMFEKEFEKELEREFEKEKHVHHE